MQWQFNNSEAITCLLESGADPMLTLQKPNSAKSWKILSALSVVQLACVFGCFESLKALNPVSGDEYAVTKEGELGILSLSWNSLIDVYKAEKKK